MYNKTILFIVINKIAILFVWLRKLRKNIFPLLILSFNNNTKPEIKTTLYYKIYQSRPILKFLVRTIIISLFIRQFITIK